MEKFTAMLTILKWSRLQAWQEILQEQLRASAEGVRCSLQAVIHCEGGHFEQNLYFALY